MDSRRNQYALIIYTASDGNAHFVKARQYGNAWRYTDWKIISLDDLNVMLADHVKRGAIVLDVRVKAAIANPGMEHATPIIVASGVPLSAAFEAFKALHEAILKS